MLRNSGRSRDRHKYTSQASYEMLRNLKCRSCQSSGGGTGPFEMEALRAMQLCSRLDECTMGHTIIQLLLSCLPPLGTARESGACVRVKKACTRRASVHGRASIAPSPPITNAPPTLLRSQQRTAVPRRPASVGKVGARSLEPSVRGRADAHDRAAQPQQKV